MRGDDPNQEPVYTFLTLERRIPQVHPLRAMRGMVDRALVVLSGDFDALHSKTGRLSIAPERLLRALLLQVLYTVRSERMLMEQLDHNLLFRWFVDLTIDDPVWNASTFSKNRDRLLARDVAQRFFAQVIEEARSRRLLSNEHFTVDRTLVEAWASQKSLRPKDGGDGPPTGTGRNAEVDFRGRRRSNDTHVSTTDPGARLFRKNRKTGAVRCYMGHVLMGNRNGLAVSGRLSHATGHAEREAAVSMVAEIERASPRHPRRRQGVRDSGLRRRLRQLGVTPHVAQNDRNRSSAIGQRTTRHEGYDISQRKRKRVEEIFGWMKAVGCLRKTRHRGREQVGWVYLFTLAAYNLVRIERSMMATG